MALFAALAGIGLSQNDAAHSAPIATPLAAATEPPPLADRDVRFHEMLHQLFGLQAVYETIPGLVFDTTRNFPREWGRTLAGTGKRFGNQYSQFLMSEMIEFGVGSLHHEDPRYFRLGEGAPMGQRVWNVVKSPWIARNANGDGTSRVALGRISGVYGAWGIASRWSPDSVNGVAPFFIWGTFGMGTKAGGNAFREFWPDAKRRYFSKKHSSEDAATP